MNKEQFDREKRYGAAMAVARTMHAKGLITKEEYHKIDTIFLRKYAPIIGGLRAKIP